MQSVKCPPSASYTQNEKPTLNSCSCSGVAICIMSSLIKQIKRELSSPVCSINRHSVINIVEESILQY